jgi:hypothetical protein
MSGAHAAHIAAEQRKRRMQEEEERMTPYKNSELNEQWEFKIVRSVTNEFKKPGVFRNLIEEESLSGWELLEKLDDGRIRFKRPTASRRRDEMLPANVDPYRTQYGISEGALAARIIIVVVVSMGILLGTIALVESGYLF